MPRWLLNSILFLSIAVPVFLFLIFEPTIDLLRQPLIVKERIQPADVIVVFSAGLLNDCRASNELFTRETYGAELLNAGFSRSGKIILTGRYTHPEMVSLKTCQRTLAQRFGVSPRALILENQAENTYENARNTRAIMDAHGWKSALIVTHFSHALRAVWTMEARGVEAYSAQLPDPPPVYNHQWFHPNRLAHLKRFIYEYVALLQYKWYGYY